MTKALQKPDLVEGLVVVDIAPTRSVEASEIKELLETMIKIEISTLTSRREADRRLREEGVNVGAREGRAGADSMYSSRRDYEAFCCRT